MLPIPIPELKGEAARKFEEDIRKPPTYQHEKILKEAERAYEIIENNSKRSY